MVPAASADTEITGCPFTITSAGTFFLKSNLTAVGTDCIKVHHGNVGIDMRGHTIKGDGTHAGITDNSMFEESVAISHGKISHFHDGIGFYGSGVVTIEGVESSDNTNDGIFIKDFDNNLTDVKANRNGHRGIDIEECCNLLNRIQANDNAGSDGVLLVGCCSNLHQVTAKNNGDDGIDALDCCNGIADSQANSNKNDGIFMTGGDNVLSNVKTNGNNDGIFMTDGSNVLSNVKTNGNTLDGIESCCGDDDLVTNATANTNRGDGMEFSGDDDAVADSVANNNHDVGIDLHVGDQNTVSHVTANHNATGVDLSCAGDESTALRVSAHGNTVHNLFEHDGTCTNLLNSAP